MTVQLWLHRTLIRRRAGEPYRSAQVRERRNAMLNETGIEKLQARGELIQRGDPSYEEARKVFNGMVDKRPA